MTLSKRLEKLPPYLFVEINNKIAKKKAQGIDVISFAIGDPDIPTPPHIIDRLCSEAKITTNHRYPETSGLPELCLAISEWYHKRFGVSLDPNKEVLPLIGSKEGIGHLSFCYIDQGDIAIVTDPGYPVYGISTSLAGGEPFYIPLKEENNYLPILESIPKTVLEKAKLLWLNYPNNPTGAVADVSFFEKVVDFAHRHKLLICHDAPYSEVSYDNYKVDSLLQIKKAKDISIEFHSFSKTYNMTGWRIGMAVGNAEIINALFRFKSNLDSGIPQAIQYMAIEALTGTQVDVINRNQIYKKRRDKLCKVLSEIGIRHQIPKAGFYIWAHVPDGFSSINFTAELLDKANIAVTPGNGYGPSGEGFIRFSITVPDEKLDEGIKRLLDWHYKR
jgi:LL-diaminopimelate aminotransferase